MSRCLCRLCCSRAGNGTDYGGIAVVPCRMAGSGFWAATIPAQNSLITTNTDTITIPVQADIMAVDLKAITVAVLMAVAAADMAGIESSVIPAALMNADLSYLGNGERDLPQAKADRLNERARMNQLTLPDFRSRIAAWRRNVSTIGTDPFSPKD